MTIEIVRDALAALVQLLADALGHCDEATVDDALRAVRSLRADFRARADNDVPLAEMKVAGHG